MGSDFGKEFCTLDEAMKRLGRSKRSIHYYVRDGLLTKEVRSGEIVLRKEDVEQLAIELGTDQPAMNRKSFLLLSAKVRRLEMDMAVVKRALNVQTEPLRPSNEEALTLHRSASAALTIDRWNTDQAMMWAGVFDRLDEIALEAVGDATSNTRPWEIFYTLCLRLLKACSYQPDFKTSLELQQVNQALIESRKKLRAIIVMWTEMGRGTIPPGVLKRLDTGAEEVMNRLSGKQK